MYQVNNKDLYFQHKLQLTFLVKMIKEELSVIFLSLGKIDIKTQLNDNLMNHLF